MARLVLPRGPDGAKAPRVVWTPNAGSQALFLACPFREVINTGTRGSAKTDALLMDFAQEIGRWGEDWRGILFRRTYKQLDDIVARSRKWFRRIFPQARFNESDYVWRWPGGEELLLRYFDRTQDYWNYHGHQYPWIGWEELTNWPTLDGYHAMKSCNRSGRVGIPLRYRANTNPHGLGHHEVKAYIVDPAPAGVPIAGEALTITGPDGEDLKVPGWVRVRIQSHWSENRPLLEASPDYPATIKQAAGGDVAKERAWLDEDWDIVAGGMFSDVWERGLHVLKPFAIPPSWRIDRAFDWGSAKPFSVGWWAESDGTAARLADGTLKHFPPRTLIRIAEWYGWNGKPNRGAGLSDSAIAQGILRREHELGLAGRVAIGPADASMFDEENGDSPALIQQRHGVRWDKADKSPGTRVRGWKLLRDRLKATKEKSREEPGLYVFETCTHFIRTVPIAPRHETKLDDVDTESEDHVLDETRYRILAPRREWKTSTVRI